MEYIALVACTPDNGIGFKGQLPWPRLKYDMQRFVQLTRNHTVVMGSKTYISIGHPLKNRRTVVFTHNDKVLTENGSEYQHQPDVIVHNLKEFDSKVGNVNRVYICGGAQIYQLFASRITHVLQTVVHTPYKSDVYIDWSGMVFTKRISSDIINDSGNGGVIRYRFDDCVTRVGMANGMSLKNISDAVSMHPNVDELNYLDMLRQILTGGEIRENRTGIPTISISGGHLEFSLENGKFPLLTTKKMFLRGIVEELKWFLSGDCYSTDYLKSKNVKIWDGNSTRSYLDSVGLTDYREGELGPIYGYQWRHFNAPYMGPDHDYSGQGVDQIADVIHQIRTNPTSRRILFHSWNPCQLKQMALPPCHVMYMFYVHNDGRLDCHMIQRSCDSFLGLPFNIASTALLTILLARITCKIPGKIRVSFNDLHIYRNHVEQVLTQINRPPYPFPTLHLDSSITELSDFCYEKIRLEGYMSHDAIPAKMAV